MTSQDSTLKAKDIGFLIRNALRISFRAITCVVSQAGCTSCSIRNSCLYNSYFNRTVNGFNAKAFNLNADFSTNQDGHVDNVNINLKIWGDAKKHKSFFVFAIMRMAKTGLGKDRTAFSIDYIYDATEDKVLQGNYQKAKLTATYHVSKQNAVQNKVYLQFLSPVRLNANNEIKVNIGPREIIEAIQDRFKLLQSQYGICSSEDMPAFDMPSLDMERKSLKWVSWSRHSYIQGKKISMGGYVGHMIFYPADEQVRTWLSIGETIGLGVGTSFGLGRIDYKIQYNGR
jgi:hypothetical protein